MLEQIINTVVNIIEKITTIIANVNYSEIFTQVIVVIIIFTFLAWLIRSFQNGTPLPEKVVDPDEVNSFVGIDEQRQQIKNFLQKIKDNPNAPGHLLLLSGPPGVGKKNIMYVLLQELGFEKKLVETAKAGDQWLNQYPARMNSAFSEAFGQASADKPLALVFESIDRAFPSGAAAATGNNPESKNIGLAEFERGVNVARGRPLVIIGITTDIQLLPPRVAALRNTSVFFRNPNLQERQELILTKLRGIALRDVSILDRLAEATAGCSPSVLAGYLESVRNELENSNARSAEQVLIEKFESLRKSWANQYSGFTVIPPVLKLREENPFEGLVSLNPSLTKIARGTIKFLKHPEFYKAASTKIHFNYLFYGPPGTGKTSLAEAVAKSCSCVCLHANAGTLQNNIAKFRELLSTAEHFEKAIIFIDEIHALSEDEFTQLQTMMEGFGGQAKGTNIVIWAATNYRYRIPKPILARFHEREVPLPDQEARKAVFQHYIEGLREKILFNPEVNLQELCGRLAASSDGCSQRTIRDIVSEAVKNYITEHSPDDESPIPIQEQYFNDALQEKRERDQSFNSQPHEFSEQLGQFSQIARHLFSAGFSH